MVKNSPGAMSRSRFSIATTSPNTRRTPRSRTAASAAKSLLENRQAPVELLVRRRERREQADHVPVEPAREQDEAAFARRRRHPLRCVPALLAQLEREHRAEAAHLADDVGVLGGDLVEPRAQQRRDLLRALAEPGRSQ